MEEMKVSELIDALVLIGKAYRSADGTRPADAILKIISQLESHPCTTLAQWVTIKQQPKKQERKTKDPAIGADDLAKALKSLEEVADEKGSAAAFAELDKLNIDVSTWKKLAKMATGQNEKNKSAAKLALRSHLSGRAQFKQRRDAASRLFS